MPITYEGVNAIFTDIVTVEEAEGLVSWLQEHKDAVVDMKDCEHLHSACLQALLVFKPKVINAGDNIGCRVFV